MTLILGILVCGGRGVWVLTRYTSRLGSQMPRCAFSPFWCHIFLSASSTPWRICCKKRWETRKKKCLEVVTLDSSGELPSSQVLVEGAEPLGRVQGSHVTWQGANWSRETWGNDARPRTIIFLYVLTVSYSARLPRVCCQPRWVLFFFSFISIPPHSAPAEIVPCCAWMHCGWCTDGSLWMCGCEWVSRSR